MLSLSVRVALKAHLSWTWRCLLTQVLLAVWCAVLIYLEVYLHSGFPMSWALTTVSFTSDKLSLAQQGSLPAYRLVCLTKASQVDSEGLSWERQTWWRWREVKGLGKMLLSGLGWLIGRDRLAWAAKVAAFGASHAWGPWGWQDRHWQEGIG